MYSSDFSFSSRDGQTIYCKKWANPNLDKPKGIIQIAHGMAEHIGRYDAFANVLVGEGFVVYGNDHRGHGKTGEQTNSIGFFANEDGFNKVVDDMYELTAICKNEYENIPVFLFGHSMGSFLARRYMQLHGDEIAGVILSGTGGNPGIVGKIGAFIAKLEMKRKGKQSQSELMNKLTFGNYNKGYNPARTDFDWLTRDEKEVDKYINDPLCGGVFSAGFYYDLLTGIQQIHDHGENKKIPLNLPVYLLAGAQDPVGNYSKGVLQTAELYKRLGIKDVAVKLYENGRHEILNELNREEVYQDVIDWITKKLTK